MNKDLKKIQSKLPFYFNDEEKHEASILLINLARIYLETKREEE